VLRLTLLAPDIVEAILGGRPRQRGCSWTARCGGFLAGWQVQVEGLSLPFK
jgi:hypothetical protein